MSKGICGQIVFAFLLAVFLNIAAPLAAAPRERDDPSDVRDRVIRVVKRVIRSIARPFDDISIPKP